MRRGAVRRLNAETKAAAAAFAARWRLRRQGEARLADERRRNTNPRLVVARVCDPPAVHLARLRVNAFSWRARVHVNHSCQRGAETLLMMLLMLFKLLLLMLLFKLLLLVLVLLQLVLVLLLVLLLQLLLQVLLVLVLVLLLQVLLVLLLQLLLQVLLVLVLVLLQVLLQLVLVLLLLVLLQLVLLQLVLVLLLLAATASGDPRAVRSSRRSPSRIALHSR
ncbi:unnamed protein product [Lampetra planeri]